jgi:hypothetical protein
VHDDVVFHMATDVAADLDDNNDVDIDVAWWRGIFRTPGLRGPILEVGHISAQNFSLLKSIQPTKNTHHI